MSGYIATKIGPTIYYQLKLKSTRKPGHKNYIILKVYVDEH